MKVKDLLKEIKEKQKTYSDFLEWEVFTEQISESQKKSLKKEFSIREKTDLKNAKPNQKLTIKDSEDWEYFRCFGYNTCFTEQKIFTVNVNY